MNDLKTLYLHLIKRSLTCGLYEGMDGTVWSPRGFLQRLLLKNFVPPEICFLRPVNIEARNEGKDWPYMAQTMVGSKRLDNLQFCVERVLADRVSGDLIETGVWRGRLRQFSCGPSSKPTKFQTDASGWRIHFRGCHNLMQNNIPLMRATLHHQFEYLAVSLEQVRANFQRYGLLDDQVRFLKGWFKDTLPSAPIEKLSIIRLDGDMYESTMDGLVNLYPKLSPGGFLIVDDYGAVPACKKAVHDYREQHGIREEIHSIDWTGVYWRRSAVV